MRKATTASAKLVIDSDTHQQSPLRSSDELGVAIARRGWARASDVIDTLPVAEFPMCLGDARARPESPAPARRSRR